jgi:hypothetical protein
MRQSSFPTLGILLGIAACLVTDTAFAATFNTTLDTLVGSGANNAGITLGDKRYSGFTFSSSGDAPVAASAVDVSLVSTDNDNHYQLRFSFTRDLLDSSAGQTTDVVIGYRVDVLGTQLINRVGLGFDGSVAGSTAGDAASVVETIRTTDESEVSPAFPGQDQIVISVFNDGTGGLPDSSSSSLAVNPTRALLFEKDILVSSRPGGGRVVITTVDNFVDQVPEPTSCALVAVAAPLLLARRRARPAPATR